MELSALLIFVVALALAAGSPGPSIAALVARVLAHGWRGTAAFAAAMWIGEAIWLTLAVFGLAALAEELHWGFVAIKYAGVAYLLWLAWKMWHAPVAVDANLPTAKAASHLRMFCAGLAVTLGNPKIMVFYLALLPTILELGSVTTTGWLVLTGTLLVVLAAIDGAYILLAAQARHLLKSPRGLRLANRLGATAMGGAAAAIAAR